MNTVPLLKDWSALNGSSWPTLVMGNGVSIHVWGKFQYASLYAEAKPNLGPEAQSLFFKLKNTTNFETALEAALHARITVELFKAPKTLGRINDLYNEVRQSLFDVVHKVHVLHATAEPALLPMATELELHDQVFTTNYDLLPYWAIMAARNAGRGRLADLFYYSVFDRSSFAPSGYIPIYYLHGGLHLWHNPLTGAIGKRTAGGSTLLDNLASFFSGSPDSLPLFISEGTSDEKLRKIRASDYLFACLDRLTNDDSNTVIVGAGLGEVDKHLVDAINAGSPKNIAISIFDHGQGAKAIKAQTADLEALSPTTR